MVSDRAPTLLGCGALRPFFILPRLFRSAYLARFRYSLWIRCSPQSLCHACGSMLLRQIP